FAPASRNQVNSRRDGNWWQLQNRSSKLDYATGFLDGMDLGHNFSFWAIKNDPKMEATSKVAETYTYLLNKYVANVTNFQMVDGLDKFYEDFRNRRIEVSAGVWLVLNEISGKSEPEMQKMIENWRKSAAQSQ